MKKYRNLLFVGLIIGAALFLRAYKISSNYYFSGELGKEMLFIRQFAVNREIPLVGMATSHEWLSYGPLYYWIMIPIYILFTGNPFILFWVALAAALIGLVLNYAIVGKIAGQKVAVVSTLIQVVSPLLIWQTRLGKLHVFFWILMPLFMLLTYYLWNGKKKWVLPAGILFGLLFSFHFSQIPLLGVVALVFLIKKNFYGVYDWIKFGIGVIIPNSTFIWQDRNLALWLPYRVFNIENKNPGGTIAALNEYFGKNIFWDSRLWVFGLIIFIGIFVHYIYKNRKKLSKEFLPFYLVSSIGLMLTANILHGSPPAHYFLPVFTITPILLAIYVGRIKLWPAILVAVTAVNLFAFAADPYFYRSFSGNIAGKDFVSFETQKQIASFIVASSDGKDVSVKRIGPFDYFPENYSQNYKYLIFYEGGKVTDNSGNIYTIVENSGGVYVQK